MASSESLEYKYDLCICLNTLAHPEKVVPQNPWHSWHIVPRLLSSSGKSANECVLERSAGRSDSSPTGFDTNDGYTTASSPANSTIIREKQGDQWRGKAKKWENWNILKPSCSTCWPNSESDNKLEEWQPPCRSTTSMNWNLSQTFLSRCLQIQVNKVLYNYNLSNWWVVAWHGSSCLNYPKPLPLSTCPATNGASSSWNRWIGRWGCSRTDTSRLSSSLTTSTSCTSCLRVFHRFFYRLWTRWTSEQKVWKSLLHMLLLHMELITNIHASTNYELWTSVNSIEKLQLFKSWHQRKRPWRLHQYQQTWRICNLILGPGMSGRDPVSRHTRISVQSNPIILSVRPCNFQ